MRVRLKAYGPSNGAREVAKALGIKRLKLENSKFRPRYTDLFINWGCSVPFVTAGRIINLPSAVMTAASKLRSLTVMKEAGVTVPDFTRDHAVAKRWLEQGAKVVGRQLDRGSSGRGIVLMTKLEEWQACPLYTLYVPKKDEYRVHVMRGQVIHVQEKRRQKDAKWTNEIRTHSQGWIFATSDVNPPESVLVQARRAVDALGLDFGAVDIGYTRKTKTATVYEVNTAPGLEGTTLIKYREAFQQLINNGG